MHRYPELARLAAKDINVKNLKHYALDKITVAHMKVGMLNRHDESALEELQREERAIQAMEDATYAFRQYLRAKQDKYDELLDDTAHTQKGEKSWRQHLDL